MDDKYYIDTTTFLLLSVLNLFQHRLKVLIWKIIVGWGWSWEIESANGSFLVTWFSLFCCTVMTILYSSWSSCLCRISQVLGFSLNCGDFQGKTGNMYVVNLFAWIQSCGSSKWLFQLVLKFYKVTFCRKVWNLLSNILATVTGLLCKILHLSFHVWYSKSLVSPYCFMIICTISGHLKSKWKGTIFLGIPNWRINATTSFCTASQ